MKKALENSKFTNKCQHLGENKAVSKWQGVSQVAQGPDEESWAVWESARHRAGAKWTSTGPVWQGR